MMSFWLRGRELEGSMTSALRDRQTGEERGGKNEGSIKMYRKKEGVKRRDKQLDTSF